MAFTYTPFSTNRDRVRFHIGDTNAAAPIFQDEALDALIAESGGWQSAVIAALEHLIALVSKPDFRADWLEVSHQSARLGYEQVLRIKRAAFGMAALRSGAVQVQRVDE